MMDHQRAGDEATGRHAFPVLRVRLRGWTSTRSCSRSNNKSARSLALSAEPQRRWRGERTVPGVDGAGAGGQRADAGEREVQEGEVLDGAVGDDLLVLVPGSCWLGEASVGWRPS